MIKPLINRTLPSRSHFSLRVYFYRVSYYIPYTQGIGADDLYEGDIEVSQPITQTVCSFTYQLIKQENISIVPLVIFRGFFDEKW